MRCMECGAEMVLTDETFAEEFQNERFEVAGVEHHACPGCGAVELCGEEMRRCYEMIRDGYRERHGLLKPAEIKALRKSMGLTQIEFENVIGVSSPTASRWETGAVVQSAPVDKLMRCMIALPDVRAHLSEMAEIRPTAAGAMA